MTKSYIELDLPSGGKIYLAKSEISAFKGILLSFAHNKTRSQTQSSVIEYLKKEKIASHEFSTIGNLYKMGWAGYFKLIQKGRARIWIMKKKAKTKQKQLIESMKRASPKPKDSKS